MTELSRPHAPNTKMSSVRRWLQGAPLQTAVKALLLLGLALFLYTRITSGLLYFYIAERFAWITFLSVFGFIAVGLSYQGAIWSRMPAKGDGSSGDDGHEHVHDHDHEHHHEHDHADNHGHVGHDHMFRWASIGLVALPLLLGVAVSPRPLGAAALHNREIGVTETRSAMPAMVRAAAQKESTELNVLEWQETIAATADAPRALAGKGVRILGFVFRDDRFAEDQFYLARFTISCCVADATPAGLIVHWPDAASLPTDQWVEVSGVIGTGLFNGSEAAVVEARSVTLAEIPNQPYLYP